MKKMGKVARLAALLVLTLLFGLFPIESENNLNKVQAATTLNNSENCSRFVYER